MKFCRYLMWAFLAVSLFFHVVTLADSISLGNRLLAAAQNSQAGEVAALLRQGADPNYHLGDSIDFQGPTALVYAAAACNAEIVSTLVKARANVNYQMVVRGTYSHLKSALMLAAYSGAINHECERVVHFLLSNGADPNLRSATGETALHWGLKSSHANFEIAQKLLSVGKYEYDQLGLAAYSTVLNLNVDVLKIILLGHPEISNYKYQTSMGATPLLAIALWPWNLRELGAHQRLVELLLASGAVAEDPFARVINNDGAMRRTFTKQLLTYGFVPNQNNAFAAIQAYYTDLHFQRMDEIGDSLEVIQLLAEASQIDVNALVKYEARNGSAVDDVTVLSVLLSQKGFSATSNDAKAALCTVIRREFNNMQTALVNAGVTADCARP